MSDRTCLITALELDALIDDSNRLAALRRKALRWESQLTANLAHYEAFDYPETSRLSARTQLDLVRDVLDVIGRVA